MRSRVLVLAGAAAAYPFAGTEQGKGIFGRTGLDKKNGNTIISGPFPSLGGGLVNGVLQPLTGVLANLELPTPQPFGLKEIPGDDPDHQYQAPGPTDVRGLCPTLNTLANYGYLNRNGITTFAQSINAVQTAWGMGYDTAIVLGVAGLLAGGDLATGIYSIGGADSRVPNTFGPALGLDHHGVFEGDGSVSRQDAYFGNAADFIPSRWEAIRKQSEQYGGGYFNRDTWVANQKASYLESRNTNPEADLSVRYFAVSLIERAIIYQGVANGTNLAKADAASIEPVFLDNKFPEKWYRRPTPYSLAQIADDLVDLYSGYPFELGVNDGLNNFVPLGLDIKNHTASEIMCLLLVTVFSNLPNQFQPGAANAIDVYAGFINGVLSPFFGQFNCPAIDRFTQPSASCSTCTNPSEGAANPEDGQGVIENTPGPGEPLTNQ